MKTYKIKTTTHYGYNRPSSTREYEGTIEELRQVFAYTLEIGNSWNSKINMYPKTIKGLINSINKSFEEKNACRYTSEYVELVG